MNFFRNPFICKLLVYQKSTRVNHEIIIKSSSGFTMKRDFSAMVLNINISGVLVDDTIKLIRYAWLIKFILVLICFPRLKSLLPNKSNLEIYIIVSTESGIYLTKYMTVHRLAIRCRDRINYNWPMCNLTPVNMKVDVPIKFNKTLMKISIILKTYNLFTGQKWLTSISKCPSLN